MTVPATPSATPDASSTARAYMLGALALSFVSLFFTYSMGTVVMPIVGPYLTQYVNAEIGSLRGFSYKPYAVWILAVLAYLFATNARIAPVWERHGYWIAVALLVCFTPWSDGIVCFASLALAGYAAVLRRRALRRPERDGPQESTATV